MKSILLELKAYNALLYSLMHDSKKVFQHHTLCLEVPDTVIADGKEQELLQILEKIFCERCGLNFHVRQNGSSRPKASGGKMRSWSSSRRSRRSRSIMRR